MDEPLTPERFAELLRTSYLAEDERLRAPPCFIGFNLFSGLKGIGISVRGEGGGAATGIAAADVALVVGFPSRLK